ncbi:MarR family winged helix-turn-helix transcriptional regulator [Sphingoaurantiacus capsulatus]
MASETQRSGHALEPLAEWMSTLIGYVQSARPDLTNRQMALLMLVYLTDGPHTVRGLAAKLRVSKPVVTRALNTLGALGYLRRQKDESDLRNIFVERTQTGTQFLEEFAGLIERAEKNGANRQRSKQDESRTTH